MEKHEAFEQGQQLEQSETSGLDMVDTLKWYEKIIREGKVREIRESDFRYPVENKEFIELSEGELGGLFALFPENAQRRSILRKVVGKPATWFRKGSTSEKLEVTENRKEALSPTAIVPSYIDYGPWKKEGKPAADIWLYQIPQDLVSKEVRKLVLAEGFIHEVAHSIVQPAIYVKDYKLKFLDKGIVGGLDAILHFMKLAEEHPAISHYASTYRDKPQDNKFPFKMNENDPRILLTAVSEEMCETIAAYFLGFAYCGDDKRGKDPFEDRPRVKDFIEEFLKAKLVREEKE
jgi:hypothetical protein